MNDRCHIEVELFVNQEMPQIDTTVKPFVETKIINENDHALLENLDYESSNHTGFAATNHLPFVNGNGALMIWIDSIQNFVNSGITITPEIEIPQSLLDTISFMRDDINNMDFLADVDYDPITAVQTFRRRDGRIKTINFPIYTVLEDGGLSVSANKFYITYKGIKLTMLSDEVSNHFATKNELQTVSGTLQDFEPKITPSNESTDYWNGLKKFVDFATSVRSSVLTGLSVAATSAATAADSVLSAIGKLQAQINNVLQKNNTSAFTPTSNYHPATKKYVDDSITGGATTVVDSLMSTSTTSALSANQGRVLANNVLQKNNTTSFTPTASYHPATKKYVDDAMTGNVETATKLATARTVRTDLASTSTASFDGTANITPGVTGTLPVANGGTGSTTATAALTALGALPKSGGTMTGALYGQSNTSYTTAQVRNIYATTTDLTAGSSSLTNGAICIVYE